MKPTDIIQLLQQARFSEAESACDEIIDRRPQESSAWHLRGLARLEQTKLDTALEDLRHAIQLQPNSASYHANLAEALRRSGHYAEGADSARSALALQSDYRPALINLGCCLLKLDQAEEALRQFKQLPADDAHVLALMADAQRQLQRPIQASALYRQALKHDPDHIHAHTNLGPLLIEQGQWAAALAHCRRAVELAPDQALPLINLGRCQFLLDQLDEAMESYAQAHAIAPDSVLLSINIARAWMETGEPDQAELWLNKALEVEPENRQALTVLALVWTQNERADDALELLQTLVQQAPDNFHVQAALAEANWEEGDIPAALDHYRTAAGLRPQLASIHASIGRVLASAGRMEEAYASYRQALEINPRCVPALHGLATSLRGKLEPRYVELLEQLIEDDSLRDGARGSARNALGYYLDGIGEYDRAGEHLEQANRLQWAHKSKRGWQYDPDRYAQSIDQTMALFDRDRLQHCREKGHASEQPVFVVGMPRSGTTLTEQVLASHPEITGVGERHFAGRALSHLPMAMNVDRLPMECIADAPTAAIQRCAEWHLSQLHKAAGRSDALRIVDKMPDNYNHLGWIATTFPDARIVYCRRDPRDIAVSCWMTSFSQIQWACDQQHIAQRLIQHDRLMRHWLRVMPEKILIQDYEALVAEPETHIRRLIDWVGLPWHPDCLQFHQSNKVVRTASVSQVRQPIYQRSVKRWEAYRKSLDPLFDRLREHGLIASAEAEFRQEMPD